MLYIMLEKLKGSLFILHGIMTDISVEKVDYWWFRYDLFLPIQTSAELSLITTVINSLRPSDAYMCQ